MINLRAIATWPQRAGQRLVTNFNLHEISGSLGDLGTLLPIMVSLAVAGQINLTSTLWFGGIWNILSGVMFQVPMCVQPMKAIASTVLSSSMTIEENMSAGLGCAAIVFFLGATRTIHIVGSYTPVAVVRGIQLGAAASLIKKAHDLIKDLEWTITASNWSDNYTWVLLSFIFVMICYRTRIPSALILFLIGLIFALVRMFVTDRDLPLDRPVAAGHYPDTIIRPTPEEFRTGFANAGLGQIPLTALNSVIALSALIDDLFPDRHADTATISMSVGAMNLIGCWFGSMPFCHGSGGLAGQYRFGARSEVSVVILGLFKLFLGILFGSSLVGLLQVFPNSILAVLLFISGVELGSAARAVNNGVTEEWKQRENWTIMLITMGAIIAFSNDGIGFLTGLVTAVLLAMQRLGPIQWCRCVIDGIKMLPYNWKHQDAFVYRKASSDVKPIMDADDTRRDGLPKPVTTPSSSSASDTPVATHPQPSSTTQ
ncbi:hypothetical protein O0I10_005697 [Lichtheimia ornata]|uniref:Sulfate transporter n=1 Tax=Lichtheimia ornata TaxID=688661 RepID=A0AAD7Y1I9_9FUNG|nr:uncharacterized protein O0I10_005697 [Lichtheimia ornata]KAJ8658657.1 hypothetical protein O0I10_005697 [Lichtheimia ornata]